jgi:hypothetical protein
MQITEEQWGREHAELASLANGVRDHPGITFGFIPDQRSASPESPRCGSSEIGKAAIEDPRNVTTTRLK